MMENQHPTRPSGHPFPCRGMCDRSGCRIFCGIFLIVIGSVWFLKKAGWISPDIIAFFWPLAFITLGVVLIAAAILRRERHTERR